MLSNTFLFLGALYLLVAFSRAWALPTFDRVAANARARSYRIRSRARVFSVFDRSLSQPFFARAA